MPDAALTVNSTVHLGWTSISVTRSLETLAPTFELELTERWSDSDQPIPVIEGDECTLALDDEDVTAGYIDTATISYDARQHSMSVKGRAYTGDLVDCSAIFARGKGQWINQPLQQIAIDLCRPFGIDVSVQADLGRAFSSFAIQDGESVHEALERACRMRGVLMLTSGSGELVFTRTGNTRTRTVIRFGDNVIRGEREGSWVDRFSQYIIKAQMPTTDNFFGEPAVAPKRTSADGDVDRYRPLIVQAEGADTGSELQTRADWERNVRAGRSQRLKYRLDGWTNHEGLWAPNTLVRVVDPRLKVDTELLVVSAALTKSEAGTFTDLELCDKKGFTVEPLTPKPRREESWL